MCLGERRDVDCGVLCVQGPVRMLTVVCFLYSRKAGGGSDKDADCGVHCVQEKGRMLTVVYFVLRRKAECCGMLCVQGESGMRQ